MRIAAYSGNSRKREINGGDAFQRKCIGIATASPGIRSLHREWPLIAFASPRDRPADALHTIWQNDVADRIAIAPNAGIPLPCIISRM